MAAADTLKPMTAYIHRQLDLVPILRQKSCFLFGPRQTGKSSLVRHLFKDEAVFIDLLDDEIFLRLQQNPKALGEFRVAKKHRLIVIDEVQRVPQLLNEVHRLIEKEQLRFLLMGSSARKLRKNGVNLLGGRARSRSLHPLVSGELKKAFSLSKALQRGMLPSIYFSDDPWDDLKSYVGDYLTQEILAEAATRNLPAFTRFLEVAAISNGQMINHEKISSDAQVPRTTIQSYYEILRDTLIGRDLPAFRKTKSRKAITTSKFYFFDLGVVNYLKRVREIFENSSDFGFAFEAWVFHELSSYCDYRGTAELTYWRSRSGFEVDFLLNDEIAIEVKASKSVGPDDLRGLNALSEELKLKRKVVICRENVRRKVGDIEIVPYADFFDELWSL